MDSNHPPWDNTEISAIALDLSPERFATYQELASTEAEALQHYAWNTAISAAFYGPLQCLEITLRNSVHRRLSKQLGSLWYAEAGVLRKNELNLSRRATAQVTRLKKDPSPGRVVAELSFGFWVGLFANVYDETLWRQDLYQLFSPRPKRKHLHDDLDRLRTLRNRVAHHEPVLRRNLAADFDRISWILKALSPETHAWMAYHSRTLEVLANGAEGVTKF